MLRSGIRCPKSVCGECMDYYYEACNITDLLRPYVSMSYCYKYVNTLTGTVMNVQEFITSINSHKKLAPLLNDAVVNNHSFQE